MNFVRRGRHLLAKLALVAVVMLAGAAVNPAAAQQSTVTLGAGSVLPGGNLNLTVSLANSGGAQPAAVQWSMSYPTSVVASVNVVSGTASTGASKTLFTCSSTTGSTQCLVYGMNNTAIAAGVLATATFSIAAGAPGGTTPVQVTGVVVASPTATSIPASGVNGAITVTGAQTFSISGTVSPAASGTGTTVTLSGAANAATTANVSGVYTFSGLANGSYTVTPTKTGFTFTPPSQAVTIAGANQTANFTAQTPNVSVSVNPLSASLSVNATQQFTATVTGTATTGVTWTRSPAVGTISAAGLYTAPSSIASQQTVTVTATSIADATKSASATVTLTVVSVSMNPPSATLNANDTRQFAATVTGSANTAVTWTRSPAVGTVSAAGLYTAPGNIASQQTVTITATSVADGTKSATAAVTLTPVSVSVNPPSATLSANALRQFTATVTGSANTTVTWTLSPNVGTISTGGMYTAPASIATQQTVTVTATSAADATKSATATITLTPTAVVSVSLNPGSVSLGANGTQQFAATVSGSANTAVTWTMSPNVGTLSAAGMYTAPASVAAQQTVTVTATSVADPTKFDDSTVTLTPVSVTLNPPGSMLSANGTQQFTAMVTGSANTAVTWTLSPNVGTVSTTGLYTAPGTITSQQVVTVTATSVADPTKFDDSVITLNATPVVNVSVNPPNVSLTANGTQQFTATVTGSANTAVTWTLPPNSGTLSPTGLYTAPAVITNNQTVTLTATSVADPTKTDNATVTLLAGSVSGPAISSVNPNPVPASSSNQTLLINGSGFQNAAGLKVRLTQPSGQTDLQGAQVTFLTASQLSIQINAGTTQAAWSVQVINPDGQSSNTMTFQVAVQLSATTPFVLPQFVFGNGWYTALYFSNTTSSPMSLQVNFFSDSGGPLNVPLLGVGTVSSQVVNLDPQTSVLLEAPNGSVAGQGWAEAKLPAGVTGYAVFRQSVPGRADQEAVVPLAPENSQAADLIYDDSVFATAVAFLNPSNQSTTVTIAAAGMDGSALGSAQVVLSPHAKQSMILRDLPGLSGMTGQRGRAVFTVAGGAVSVLGLRFGAAAFTSIPVNHRSGLQFTAPGGPSTSFALPQLVFGGGWYTAMYFSNTTATAVDFLANFFDDSGAGINVPLLGIGPVSSQMIHLAPGATAMLEAPNNSANYSEGWIDANIPAGVVGYAVFRQSVAGRPDQEAVVPLTSESNQIVDLAYDDMNFTTAVAFSNPTSLPVTVTLAAFGANGAQVGSCQVFLPPHAKEAIILKNLPGMSVMGANRGWVSFSVPTGAVSVLGLRFGGQAFTSIPVQ